MKTMQWAGAILVLAGVIFGVTFVMNFVGGDNAQQSSESSRELHPLSFANKVVGEPGAELQTEVGQEGQQDFWFQNDRGQDLEVGLAGKSCTCTQVELYLTPRSYYKEQMPLQSGALQGLLAVGRGTREAALAAAWNDVMVQRAMAAEKTILTQGGNPVTVPAGAVGWVRMQWVGDKPERRQLSAGLWMEQEGVSITKLVTGVLIAEPMKSDSQVSLGTVRDRDLPRSASLRCWSLTRSSFRLQARMLRAPGSGKDAVVVGEPTPLSEEECRQLEDEEKVRQVRSGYRIPVTLKASSAEGAAALDLGHFTRTLELSSPDRGMHPVQVKVEGVVLGDVKVGRDQEGVIHLGAFRRSRGVNGQIQLETDLDDLQLELDQKRIPSFVKAQLGEPETSPSGHRVWTLKVQVLPDRVQGSFPRSDDPVFRDSAVYVKTAGSQRRVIRIPLRGSATEG